MYRLTFLLLCASTCQAQTPLVEEARENAMEAIAHLPDFLCTQQVTRDASPPAREKWKTRDKLEILVGYTKQAGEQDKLKKIDGKPTGRNLAKLGGFQSKGDFAGTLASVFRAKAETQFVWESLAMLHEHPVEVYRFTIDRAHSTYRVNWNSLLSHFDMVVGVTGRVFIDPDTKRTMRIEMEADGLPATAPIRRSFEAIEYRWVEIGGRRYLLPQHVESSMYVRSVWQRNTAVYENYRKFSTESGITFETPEP